VTARASERKKPGRAIMNIVAQSLSGLPSFLAYFGLGLVLLGAFLVIYSWVTPYNEISLIRAGNVAAAISLAGAIIGFVLPLASAIAHSVGIIDMLVWGVVALVIQIVVFFIVVRLVPHFAEAISAGRVSAATLLASLAVAVGVLNAACMTY
jgi:putative membrane protein